MKKLNILLVAASLLIGLSFTFNSALSAEATNSNQLTMTVYKSPTCGCCTKWIDHIHENEILSNIIDLDDLSAIKTKHGIQGRYRSCHTGVVTTEVGDYIFEGHVPAEYVKAFLSNPPAGSIGLSVPGMPIGSPGMEVGDRKDYYQVLLLNEDGSNSVFAHVNQAD